MNRGIALFVTLAMLLAHTLAIHDDGEGRFAFPCDQAYVALRLGRGLIYDGQIGWNPGTSAFESYPSPLWVIVCALAERVGPVLRLSTNLIVQAIGILCALGTLIVLSRFRSERIASLISPLFLAASGAFAAAAGAGLETAPFTLLAASAFYAQERGRSAPLAAYLCLACATSTDGLVLTLALACLRAFGRPNDDEGPPRAIAWAAYAIPLLFYAAMALVRWRTTGFLIAPDAWTVLAPRAGQWREGALALREFALVCATPLLLAFPAWHLVRGALSRTGSHAVFVVLCWCAYAILRGRGTQPFSGALVPALPFVCLAVQEGMIAALDGTSSIARRVTMVAFALGLVASIQASRTPGDLGPIRLQRVHERWMRPSASARFGLGQPLGRLGLVEEIEVTRRLRKIGIFLRDQVDQGSSVLTPWPGSIGYLSRQTVHDLLGRTDPLAPLDRPRSWSRRERADVAAALRRDDDFVVVECAPMDRLPTRGELAEAWRAGLDERAGEPGRAQEIERELERYELVTVPIEDYTRERVSIGREPCLLLRNRRLAQSPRLAVSAEAGRLRVGVRHENHQQIAELALQLTDEDGRTYALRPTGELDPSGTARARVALLVYDSGTREVELVSTPLPAHPGGRRWTGARASLLNPGAADGRDPWESASDAVAIGL